MSARPGCSAPPGWPSPDRLSHRASYASEAGDLEQSRDEFRVGFEEDQLVDLFEHLPQPLEVDRILALLDADEHAQPDPGEDSGPLPVDAQRGNGFDQVPFAPPVDPRGRIGDRRIA